SDQEFAEMERRVFYDPDDIDARGKLIVYHGWDKLASTSLGLTKVGHLKWMIEHHPDWDGLMLEPFRSIAPRDGISYETLKSAWQAQIEQSSQRGVVLHNAAMFFMIREPERAEALLQRAIALEPNKKLYIERLGMTYAYSLVEPGALDGFNVNSSGER